MVPVNTISKSLMFPLEVKSVEVRVMASTVPPGPFESAGAIVLPGVIVIILGAELCPLLWKRLAEFTIYACVDNPKLEKLSPDDEIVHGNLCSVALPVLHLDQQLLRLAQGHVVPVGQPDPVVLVWISKAVSVIFPAPEEIISRSPKISSSLQHSPASSVSFHVTEDVDGFPRQSDRISPALRLSKRKLVRTR